MKRSEPETILRGVSLRAMPQDLRRRRADLVGGVGLFSRVERLIWTTAGMAWVVIFALRLTTPSSQNWSGGSVDVAATVRSWETTNQFAQTGRLPVEVYRIELESFIIVKPE